MVDVWVDDRIAAGDDWFEEIQSAMERASAAVLLVSASFLGSRFVTQQEVPALLRKRSEEGLRVIPVLISPCAWQHFTWLSRMQMRPRNARPLSGMRRHNFEQELAAVANDVAEALRPTVGADIVTPGAPPFPGESPVGTPGRQPDRSTRTGSVSTSTDSYPPPDQESASQRRAAVDSQTRDRLGTRAIEIADAASNRVAYGSGSSLARVVIVPVVAEQILDDLTLNRPTVADPLIGIGRDTGLLSQDLGVKLAANGTTGIRLDAGSAGSAGFIAISIDREGAIVVEADVSGSGPLGAMQVDPSRLSELSDRTAAFAPLAWQHFGAGWINEALVTIAIPGAQNRVFGVNSGSTLSLGGAMTLPVTVVAPNPPTLASISDLGSTSLTERLLASVELVFRDARALAEP